MKVLRIWLPVLFLTLSLSCTARAFEQHHAIGMGYQAGHISSKTTGRFHFRSLPVSYLGRFGGAWAATLRLSGLFPLRARQGDVAFVPSAEYDKTQQWDAFLGISRRFTEVLGFEVDASLGAHLHYIRFQSATFVEWSSAASGLGIGGAARHVLIPSLWGGRAEWGLSGDINYDFIDISRGGDLRAGVQAQVMALLGWAWGASS